MCGPEAMAARAKFFGLATYLLVVGALWADGYALSAGSLAALPVAAYLLGPRLVRGFDRLSASARLSLRSSRLSRKPGLAYCPACDCELRRAEGRRPVAAEECPRCAGAWCDSRELLPRLSLYPSAEDGWRPAEREELAHALLCPRCASPLELGRVGRLGPLFGRCAPCAGHWIDRMGRAWFDMTPPPAKRLGA